MRKPVMVIALALIAVWFCVMCAKAIVDTQPRYSAQMHNAYWPYSVETCVKDR